MNCGKLFPTHAEREFREKKINKACQSKSLFVFSVLKVNGQSLLGVKLSEAQSFLVKSSDSITMIVCDGFNVPQANTITNTPMAPFPRVNKPQASASCSFGDETPILQNKTTLNGHIAQQSAGLSYSKLSSKTPKLELNSPPFASSIGNYDNLRNIDSDELNADSQSNAHSHNGNGHLKNLNSTPIASQTLTDKNLMSNILNSKSSPLNHNDPKSQSMFQPNSSSNTPLSLVGFLFLFFFYLQEEKI